MAQKEWDDIPSQNIRPIAWPRYSQFVNRIVHIVILFFAFREKFVEKLFTIEKIYGIMIIGGKRGFMEKGIKIPKDTENKKR